MIQYIIPSLFCCLAPSSHSAETQRHSQASSLSSMTCIYTRSLHSVRRTQNIPPGRSFRLPTQILESPEQPLSDAPAPPSLSDPSCAVISAVSLYYIISDFKKKRKMTEQEQQSKAALMLMLSTLIVFREVTAWKTVCKH